MATISKHYLPDDQYADLLVRLVEIAQGDIPGLLDLRSAFAIELGERAGVFPHYTRADIVPARRREHVWHKNLTAEESAERRKELAKRHRQRSYAKLKAKLHAEGLVSTAEVRARAPWTPQTSMTATEASEHQRRLRSAQNARYRAKRKAKLES